MLKIKEFAFTAYPVLDLARARRFYEGVLGLTPTAVYIKDDFGWVEYESNGATFALAAVLPDWKPSEQGAVIAFEVEDFDAAVMALKNAKVPFKTEPFETPGCRMCNIFDPEGNSVTIHKRLHG
jgi:predicted enzyme related to lactoylglutathione lyase